MGMTLNMTNLLPKQKRKIFQLMISGQFYGEAPKNMNTYARLNKFSDAPHTDDRYKANTFQPDWKTDTFAFYLIV